MRLNRLAWHEDARWLAHSATARMAPAVLGASGCMYLQDQMLQRHPKDERLSVFKAEYGWRGLTTLERRITNKPIGPETILLS